MLVQKYDTEDLSVCEEFIICDNCPCYVKGCMHPYINEDVQVGNTIIPFPSAWRKDARLSPNKIYIVLEIRDGEVKISLSGNETEWYPEEDFVLIN